MEYINYNDIYKKFSELKNDKFEIEKDSLSNIIFRSEGIGKRILVHPVFELNRLIVKKVSEKEAELEAAGYMDTSALKDKEVFYNGTSVGIIRERKGEENKTVYYVELWDKNTVHKGDFLNISMYTNCKDSLLYSNNINLNIAEYICKNIMLKKFNDVNCINFAVCFDANSVISLANRIDADIILPVYAAETGDSFESEKGCGLVLKDGGFVLRSEQRKFFGDNYTQLNCAASDNALQFFIGSQCPIIERLSLLCRGQVYPLAIPAKHLGSYAELVSSKDIDSAVQLIYNILNTEV
ncbi:MAG: hypothetical protein Q4E94_05405 [Clostridia bacterium]|nr:hypothetical protein [Clostridia bacterium]